MRTSKSFGLSLGIPFFQEGEDVKLAELGSGERTNLGRVKVRVQKAICRERTGRGVGTRFSAILGAKAALLVVLVNEQEHEAKPFDCP